MDMFHVETGSVPAGTCHEEPVPTLHGLSSSCKDGSSKVFLVHDSLTCIANVALGLSECKPDAVVEGHRTKDKSPERKKPILQMVDYKSTNQTKPGCPEYRCLSPRNLEHPAISPSRSTTTTKDYLEETLSQSETDALLESRECDKTVSSLPDHISTASSSEESRKRSQRSNASTLSISSIYDQRPSTSSSPENQEIHRKKTLEELAREWHATQKNGRNEDALRKPSMRSCCEEESMLVRHTIYYTTSSVSREECRFKNRLKARMHLNDDNVKRLRSYGGQPLVKLARD